MVEIYTEEYDPTAVILKKNILSSRTGMQFYGVFNNPVTACFLLMNKDNYFGSYWWWVCAPPMWSIMYQWS